MNQPTSRCNCPPETVSASDGYCDLCGRPRGSSNGPPPVTHCGNVLTGRFCEDCGWDSWAVETADPLDSTDPLEIPTVDEPPIAIPQVPPRSRPAQVVVRADRAYFEAVQALNGPDVASIHFPEQREEIYFPLDREQILIGRNLGREGIDLSGLAEDPGVSHHHARLYLQPGGSWAVEDLRSTNGTRVNHHGALLAPFIRVPLGEGDHLYLGAWTRLTLLPSGADLP